jgi:hypothetical protein
MKLLLSLAIFFSFLLSLSSASAQVLAEAFRSIGCVNCIDPDKQFEDFITAHPEYNVNIVYLHNNISTSDDPFYAVSKADVDARMATNFYNVFADPDVFISGFDGGTSASNESNWEKLAAQPASAAYLGTLSVTATVGPMGKVKVILHAGAPSQSVQVRPFVMLVESGIQYANTEGYGNPPGNVWNNVFRAMIPAPQGGASLNWNSAQDFQYSYDPSGKPWNLTNCKIYALLQEVTAQGSNSFAIDAFAVTQITKSGVSSKTGTSTYLSVPVPNPAPTFSRIPFHLASPANVRIVISDDLGREIATVVNSFISENESSAIFYPHIAYGVYYARMYADGAFVGMQKIVFAP